jgi:hypothetical protein
MAGHQSMAAYALSPFFPFCGNNHLLILLLLTYYYLFGECIDYFGGDYEYGIVMLILSVLKSCFVEMGTEEKILHFRDEGSCATNATH